MSDWLGVARATLGMADVGVSDMCLLESVDEDSFVENLSTRFTRNQIYVNNMLISLFVKFCHGKLGWSSGWMV